MAIDRNSTVIGPVEHLLSIISVRLSHVVFRMWSVSVGGSSLPPRNLIQRASLSFHFEIVKRRKWQRSVAMLYDDL